LRFGSSDCPIQVDFQNMIDLTCFSVLTSYWSALFIKMLFCKQQNDGGWVNVVILT
jgi:hypothetical protein